MVFVLQEARTQISKQINIQVWWVLVAVDTEVRVAFAMYVKLWLGVGDKSKLHRFNLSVNTFYLTSEFGKS